MSGKALVYIPWLCMFGAVTLTAGELVVLKLPAKPIRYSHVTVPMHMREALADADNTPADNELTDAGATLGRVLFYDTQLSKNNSISCASCHLQEKGFSDPRQFSLGFEGLPTKRNAMSIANLRYTVLRGNRPGFFWDERAATLEAQVLMPIQDAVEMGMELKALEQKLTQLPYYPPLFESAFGSPKVTSDRIAKAVAQFMRAMVSFDSKFDRAAAQMKELDYSQDFEGFTAEENRGKALFINGVGQVAEIGCAHCHMPPTFAMPTSFNNGLDLHYVDQGLGARNAPSNDPFTPNNNGKFKASSLRNIALTAPYMHDGRFKTLAQVIDHYSGGVHPHENVAIAFSDDQKANQKTSGFNLSDRQKSALIAFLMTLTDERFISDPKYANPFTTPRSSQRNDSDVTARTVP